MLHGFVWGAISDRFGVRVVVLSGAVLLGAGLVIASRATSLLTFQLGYGILVGLSAGAFFAPVIAAVTAWVAGAKRFAPRSLWHGFARTGQRRHLTSRAWLPPL
jgi:MFS family permease